MTTELQNKVWSILPKEFKEEVKRHFFKKNAQSPFSIECDVLCKYFGHHNLTSDAEGEDELLTVTRSKVQEQYALNSNALRKGNLTDMQTEIAVKVKDTLYYLFGAKCLPDETKEPKPAESKKYKRGDWVKMPNGDIAAITAVGVNNEYSLVSVMKQGTSYARWYAKDLEPYTGDKQETKQETNSLQNGNTHYSGNHFPDVSKMVDTRLHIAAMVMAGALANNEISSFDNIQDHAHKSFVTQYALEYADALIAECEKRGKL